VYESLDSKAPSPSLELIVSTLTEAVGEIKLSHPNAVGLILYGSRTHDTAGTTYSTSKSDADLVPIIRGHFTDTATINQYRNVMQQRLTALGIQPGWSLDPDFINFDEIAGRLQRGSQDRSSRHYFDSSSIVITGNPDLDAKIYWALGLQYREWTDNRPELRRKSRG
jgi:hypothetical protein